MNVEVRRFTVPCSLCVLIGSLYPRGEAETYADEQMIRQHLKMEHGVCLDQIAA